MILLLLSLPLLSYSMEEVEFRVEENSPPRTLVGESDLCVTARICTDIVFSLYSILVCTRITFSFIPYEFIPNQIFMQISNISISVIRQNLTLYLVYTGQVYKYTKVYINKGIYKLDL